MDADDGLPEFLARECVPPGRCRLKLGVGRHRTTPYKWEVRLKIHGSLRSTGLWDSEEQAQEVRDKLAVCVGVRHFDRLCKCVHVRDSSSMQPDIVRWA